MLQRECGSGNCAKNVYTSAEPVNTPKTVVRGFPSLGVDSSYSTTWSGELLDYKIPKVPQQWLVVPKTKKKKKSKR